MAVQKCLFSLASDDVIHRTKTIGSGGRLSPHFIRKWWRHSPYEYARDEPGAARTDARTYDARGPALSERLIFKSNRRYRRRKQNF